MIRWRFYEPNPLREMLDQMIHEGRRDVHQSVRGEPMPINVHETDEAVIVEAVLPGVQPEDVEVHCGDGMLSIAARSTVEERDYFHQEYRSVEYHRQLVLPADCRYDATTADLEHGVLTIKVPKSTPKAPEKIRIQVSRRSGAGSAPIEATKGDGYDEVPQQTRGSHGSTSSKRAPKKPGK